MSQDDVDSDTTPELGSLFVECLSSVASFLDLQEVLACRLSCMEALNQIHGALTVEDCADRLSRLLHKYGVVVLGDTQRWKDAGNDIFDALACLRQLDTTDTNPLDAVLRMTRILAHIPYQSAVLYSAKFGRFCVPCHAETGALLLDAYPKCPKGKKNCELCALKIPPRIMHDDYEEEEGREAVETQDHGADNDDNEDEQVEAPLPAVDIYSTLSIRIYHKHRFQGTYPVDLENFYCKCIPNLPHDLICPLCRVSSRRTLMLSAFSYQSEPSAARELPGHMSLSFTPWLEPTRKRPRRKRDDSTNHPYFPPPEYVDMFVPRYPGQTLLRRNFRHDCKHAMAIHCASCQNFGMIVPARLCMPCHLRLDETDRLCVGGVLFRSNPGENTALRMHCRYCVLANLREDSETEESDANGQEGLFDDEENNESAEDAPEEYSYREDNDEGYHEMGSAFGQGGERR